MPTHMRCMFSPEELKDITLAEPFGFTKGCRTMKITSRTNLSGNAHTFSTMLFDLQEDQNQLTPINDPIIEKQMQEHMSKLMKRNDCPPEQFERMGL